MDKQNKLMLIVLAVFLIACISIVGIKIGIYVMKPDAFVSLAEVDMEINVRGFDGLSKAEVKLTGTPKILEVKNPDKKAEITEAIDKYEINLSKKENIKNGDKLEAVLEFPLAKDLKIKYDVEKLTVQKEVNDLPELVKTFEDIKAYEEEMDNEAKQRLTASYALSEAKNLKFETIAFYDKKITDDMLKDGNNTYEQLKDIYRMSMLYKITGEKKSLNTANLSHFEKYAKVSFKSFRKKGKEFNYEINSVHIYADGEQPAAIHQLYVNEGLEKVLLN